VSEDRLSSEQTQPSERPDMESGLGRARSRKRSAAGPLVPLRARCSARRWRWIL